MIDLFDKPIQSLKKTKRKAKVYFSPTVSKVKPRQIATEQVSFCDEHYAYVAQIGLWIALKNRLIAHDKL